ncbi:molybdopterin dinucleotide binding domain-containing protein [Streptomyces sp. NPDC020607]|uniref:molybdopterin dinucleotide binding domain-containing protein n=1 Tax=Streptomyces sp. NPDC020607 TaxID=3365082 RepID=UPI00379AA1A5
MECSSDDATAQGFREGDLMEITTPRGIVHVRLRVSGVRDGVLFLPFHYGNWDTGQCPQDAGRAANELTLTDWDPASKQPLFKTAAAALRRIEPGAGPTPAPTTAASAHVSANVPVSTDVPETAGGRTALAHESRTAPVEGSAR